MENEIKVERGENPIWDKLKEFADVLEKELNLIAIKDGFNLSGFSYCKTSLVEVMTTKGKSELLGIAIYMLNISSGHSLRAYISLVNILKNGVELSAKEMAHHIFPKLCDLKIKL